MSSNVSTVFLFRPGVSKISLILSKKKNWCNVAQLKSAEIILRKSISTSKINRKARRKYFSSLNSNEMIGGYVKNTRKIKASMDYWQRGKKNSMVLIQTPLLSSPFMMDKTSKFLSCCAGVVVVWSYLIFCDASLMRNKEVSNCKVESLYGNILLMTFDIIG